MNKVFKPSGSYLHTTLPFYVPTHFRISRHS